MKTEKCHPCRVPQQALTPNESLQGRLGCRIRACNTAEEKARCGLVFKKKIKCIFTPFVILSRVEEALVAAPAVAFALLNWNILRDLIIMIIIIYHFN